MPIDGTFLSSHRSTCTVTLHPMTLLAHDEPNPWMSVTPPIVQSSLFTFATVEDMEQRFAGHGSQPIYSRGDNPTVQLFEQKVAELEGGEAARAFSSGMGAISAAILSLVKSGDRMVCVRDVYPDAYRFMQKLLSRLNVTVEYVDGSDTDAVIARLEGAAVLYLESPTSWTMRTQDLHRLATAARQRGVVTLCDNSWATPLYQQPLKAGIDLVVHSASKYLSGHSDTVAGIVVGSQARIDAINDLTYPYLGAKLSPWEAWLLLRGMRTLPQRLSAQRRSVGVLSRRLREHPAVASVLHPTLGSDRRTPAEEGGSPFTIALQPHIDPRKFCNALRLFKLGVSWGGYESLVIPSIVSLAQAASVANALIDFDVPTNLVRLHVGLEHAEDLWQDLAQAFEQARL